MALRRGTSRFLSGGQDSNQRERPWHKAVASNTKKGALVRSGQRNPPRHKAVALKTARMTHENAQLQNWRVGYNATSEAPCWRVGLQCCNILHGNIVWLFCFENRS